MKQPARSPKGLGVTTSLSALSALGVSRKQVAQTQEQLIALNNQRRTEVKKPKNLYEQLSNSEVQTLATILGFDITPEIAGSRSKGFRNLLRETPSLDGGFALRQALRAYLEVQLNRLGE